MGPSANSWKEHYKTKIEKFQASGNAGVCGVIGAALGVTYSMLHDLATTEYDTISVDSMVAKAGIGGIAGYYAPIGIPLVVTWFGLKCVIKPTNKQK
jgi:hypothetical protein